MSEIVVEDELTQWFSTYGAITAERLLGRYHITLPTEDLLIALKKPSSFYHQLLQIPLKNVLNGIILQQANDYHIYAQKLFIDYLLSGESAKEQGMQGELTREAMENERQKLVTLGEEFHRQELEHHAMIGTSQAQLIKFVTEWQAELESALKKIGLSLKNNQTEKSMIRKAINQGLIHCSLENENSLDEISDLFVHKMNEILKLSCNTELREELKSNLLDLVNLILSFKTRFIDFFIKIQVVREQAQSYRNQFYETILRVLELIKMLPDYKIDLAQDLINRESLYFDKTIGDVK